MLTFLIYTLIEDSRCTSPSELGIIEFLYITCHYLSRNGSRWIPLYNWSYVVLLFQSQILTVRH